MLQRLSEIWVCGDGEGEDGNGGKGNSMCRGVEAQVIEQKSLCLAYFEYSRETKVNWGPVQGRFLRFVVGCLSRKLL